MTTVPFIPKPKPPVGKNGQPLIDQPKIDAIRKMRETTPKYLFRGIQVSQQRPGQYEQRGLFTDSLEDIYQAVLASVAFDVFIIKGTAIDPEMIPETESQWRDLAEGWQAKQTEDNERKWLADLKAKYPES